MITKDFINKKALDSQIDRYTIIREYIQLLFLRYFYENKIVGVKSFFKGGTELDWKFVKEKMKYYPKEQFDKESLKRKIQEFKPEEIKKGLNQFLPANYRGYYLKIREEILSFLENFEKKEII